MSCETRPNGRRYFIRTRRVNGKVVRKYVDAGPDAPAAAQIEWASRQILAWDRCRRRQIVDEIRNFETDLLLLDDLAHLLARAALEAAGFHQHARGQWRKRRVRNNTPALNPTPADILKDLGRWKKRATKGDKVGPPTTPPVAESPGLLPTVPRPGQHGPRPP